MCDKRGDPCDSICGGAGCGTCGGPSSCNNGAVTKASSALELAKGADEILANKSKQATDLLGDVCHGLVSHSFES